MDAEGAEYVLMKQALLTGALCRYSRMPWKEPPEPPKPRDGMKYEVQEGYRARTCGAQGFLEGGRAIRVQDGLDAQERCSERAECVAYLFGPAGGRYGGMMAWLCGSVPPGRYKEPGWETGVNVQRLQELRRATPRAHLIVRWHPYMAAAFGQPPGIEHEYQQLLGECDMAVYSSDEPDHGPAS